MSFAMDTSLLLESLDSLWFFANVLSSSPITQEESLADDKEHKPAKTQESEKTVNPNAEKEPENSQMAETFVHNCLKCEEFSTETSKPKAKDFSEANQRKEKKRKKKKMQNMRKMRNKKSLIVGFDRANSDYYGSWVFLERKCGSNGFGGANDQWMKNILLPINDGMEMKEQLRSWAQAVACSVR